MRPQLPAEIYLVIVNNALIFPSNRRQHGEDDTELLLSLIKTCRLFHGLFEHCLYRLIIPSSDWHGSEPDSSVKEWRRYHEILWTISSNARIANHVEHFGTVTHPRPEGESGIIWDLFEKALSNMRNLTVLHVKTMWPTTPIYRQRLSSCLLTAPFNLQIFDVIGVIQEADMELFIEFFKLQSSIVKLVWSCYYEHGSTWQLRGAVDPSILPNLHTLSVDFYELVLMYIPGRAVKILLWMDDCNPTEGQNTIPPAELSFIASGLEHVKRLSLEWTHPPVPFSKLTPHLKNLRRLRYESELDVSPFGELLDKMSS
jgi:hypothetical protein